MSEQATATNDALVEIRIELGAIILSHEAHESRMAQASMAISCHTHADGRTVEEIFQRAQHSIYV